jgi:hypothetical protein
VAAAGVLLLESFDVVAEEPVFVLSLPVLEESLESPAPFDAADAFSPELVRLSVR